jgi:hypothetical protein
MRCFRLALGLAVLAVIVLGAVAAEAAWSRIAEDAPPQAELRNCRSRAEGRAPIRMTVGPNDVRIGPLVLGNVRSAGSTGRTSDPLWPYGRKVPILLPARSRVVLAIAPEAAALAALQHRNTWVQAVRFTACFERVPAFGYRGTVGKTTFFPFGIALREPTACLPMELWMDGRAAAIRRLVPIGRRTC